jgi:rubredoxin
LIPFKLKEQLPQHFLKGDFNMDKWVCGPCGYVYDPAEGDPDGGIAPGTAFEDLPEDWVCPVCGATKDMFEKE